ncbi:MAG: LysM peptidoglycan-binding domain-containing protein [Bacteroidetes bacterium]|nr:LysM peptidoglycan-binding domain-containing protein [Bacteroidota bacterium]
MKDYYPYGMLLPGRNGSVDSYRYGFNGEENDNEVMGEGNFQNYGMRMYDPRIGRFPSVDPLTKSYPMLSPYQFSSNTPIWAVDLDGLERLIYTDKALYHEDINKKITWSVVANSGRLEWLNDPNSQDIKYDHDTGEGGGPIPEGNYFIKLDSKERLENGDKSGGAWGKYGIRLDYGFGQAVRLKLKYKNRSGFYIHEDGNQFTEGGLGSGGCIACTKGNDILKVRDQLVDYFEQGLEELEVVVDYNFESPVVNHTVKSGETVGKIAKQYNTTVEQIVKENDLKNPDVIRKGQILKIPGQQNEDKKDKSSEIDLDSFKWPRGPKY